jgi:transcriptional regulator GlxA family with amidase domain
MSRLTKDRSHPPPLGSADITRFGFVLLPEFPLYALVPAIEALRIANQHSGRDRFAWQLISIDGGPVQACNGMTLTVDSGIADVTACPTVLIFAGNHPMRHLSQPLFSWLRKLARHGSVLGGVDTGAFPLAEAGLLDGYETTVHWESITTFRERYPRVRTTEQLFTIDRNRISCAGGHATLDLMLKLITARQGAALAQIVANSFVSPQMRGGVNPQRFDLSYLSSGSSGILTRIMHHMEEHLGEPLSAREIARRSGVSIRALSRIMRDRTGEPPMRYYRKVRLQAARNALFYSESPIQEIALSCGFNSPEVFSRTFRLHFGLSPREFRQRFAREELCRYRPELELQLRPHSKRDLAGVAVRSALRSASG